VQYETGKRAAATADGLYRLKSRRVAAAYLRPGASFVGYRKLLIAPVEIFYKGEEKRARPRRKATLSPAEDERFRRIFQKALEEELGASPSFEIVEEPAPDALRVRAHVVDLVVDALTEQGGSTVYSLGAGEMTVLLDVADSESGVPIARLVDRKRIGSNESVSAADLHPYAASGGVGTGATRSADAQWTHTRRLFRRWARMLREGLEELIVLGPVPEPATDLKRGGKP